MAAIQAMGEEVSEFLQLAGDRSLSDLAASYAFNGMQRLSYWQSLLACRQLLKMGYFERLNDGPLGPA